MKYLIPFLLILLSPLFSQDWTGKTVLKGIEIVPFPVKPLGVPTRMVAGESRQLIEIEGPAFDKGGIYGGMSGSPVYNKSGSLLGAISFGWAFGKDPKGGMTPIKEMRKWYNPGGTKDTSLKLPSKLIHKRIREWFTPNETSTVELPWNDLGQHLSDMKQQGILMTGPTATAPVELGNIKGYQAKAGAMIAVAIVRGDWNAFAYGTITEVRKNGQFLAFGHPLFQLGQVRIPVHQAEVISLFPSVQNSRKMAQAGKEIGFLTQDRLSAVSGELGNNKRASMIPLNINIERGGKPSQSFNVEIVSQPLITPAFTMQAIIGILQSQLPSIGQMSSAMSGRIDLSDGQSVKFGEIFSHQGLQRMALPLAQLVYILSNNPYKPVSITGMNVTYKVQEAPQSEKLLSVRPKKRRINQGAVLPIDITWQVYHGQNRRDQIQISIPNHIENGEYILFAGSGKDMLQFLGELQTSSFPIESLDALILLLNRIFAPHNTYIALMKPSNKAVAVGPHIFRNLPIGIQTDLSTIGNILDKVPYIISIQTLSHDRPVIGTFISKIEVNNDIRTF